MKKILSFSISIALLGLVFVGCNDDDKEVQGLEILKSDVEFSSTGGQGTIELTSPASVKAASNKEWLTIDSETQSVVSFTVAANGDMMNRTATVTITSSGLTQTVSVTQAGSIFSIGDLDNLTFTSRAGVYSFEIYTNTALTVSSGESWVTAAVTDGVLTLELDMNMGLTARSADLTVAGSWKEEVFTITQNGMALEPDLTTLYANVAGNRYEVTFSDNLADYFDASTTSSWITATPDGDILVVDVEDNTTGSSRTGTIDLEMYGQTATVTVIQPAVPFNAVLIDTDGIYFFARSERGGAYLTQFDLINTQLSKDGEVLYYNYFQFMKGMDGLSLMMTAFTDNSQAWSSALIYEWVADGESDFILDLYYVQPNGGTNNADYYMAYYPAYAALVTSTLHGKRYYVAPDDVDNPTSITFTETDNASNWFTVTTTPVYYP